VHGVDDAVNRGALKVGDGPGVGSGHGDVMVVVSSGVDYAPSRADLISSVVAATLIAS